MSINLLSISLMFLIHHVHDPFESIQYTHTLFFFLNFWLLPFLILKFQLAAASLHHFFADNFYLFIFNQCSPYFLKHGYHNRLKSFGNSNICVSWGWHLLIVYSLASWFFYGFVTLKWFCIIALSFWLVCYEIGGLL